MTTITDRGSRVAVIRDIPNATDETVDCVARNQDDAHACELSPASALGTDDLMVEAAGQPGVSVVDMTDYFCTDDAEVPANCAGIIRRRRSRTRSVPMRLRQGSIRLLRAGGTRWAGHVRWTS